jgi:hypothetical protein
MIIRTNKAGLKPWQTNDFRVFFGYGIIVFISEMLWLSWLNHNTYLSWMMFIIGVFFSIKANTSYKKLCAQFSEDDIPEGTNVSKQENPSVLNSDDEFVFKKYKWVILFGVAAVFFMSVLGGVIGVATSSAREDYFVYRLFANSHDFGFLVLLVPTIIAVTFLVLSFLSYVEMRGIESDKPKVMIFLLSLLIVMFAFAVISGFISNALCS